MVYIATIVGTLIGWWVFKKFINILIGMLIFIPYSSKSKFDWLYSLADDRVTYEFLGNKKIKNYVSYLRVHEASKETAYKYFCHHHTEFIRIILTKITPLAILPAVLFWAYWYWYILGVILAVVLSLIYRLFVDQYGIGFYQKAMVYMIINQYIEDAEKSK